MNRGIISTASYYAFFSLLTQALTLVTQLILMRHFSMHDYGYIGISFEAYIFLQMIIPNALRNFYLQKIRGSDTLDNNEVMLAKLIKFQLIIGSSIIFVFGCLVAFLYSLDLYLSVLIISTTIISSIIQPLQAFWLANSKRFLVIAKDFSSALVVLFTILILICFDTINIQYILVAQFFIISFISCIFFTYYLLDRKNKKIKLETGALDFIKKTDLYSLFVFMLIFLVNSVHNKFGVMFLNKYTSLIDVAIYIAAFKFINPVFFIQSSLISAYMPKFIHEKNLSFDYKVYFTFFIPGLFIAVGLYVLFPVVIELLNIEKYLSSYSLIKIGCIFILVVFLYGALSNYISVSGGKNFILLTNVVALGIMIILCFLNREKPNLGTFVMHMFVLAECIVGIFYYLYLKVKKTNISVLYFLSFCGCIFMTLFS
ncbi:hypothetical protein [Klebsiella pneumoniae]|uniref:hypothetical protein n=1 Tax=Klebsiella pneumoniae TaxID=573 RepID=UPI0028B79DEA|nr:hypothetical protein [Klebsiella pneumoniae]